MEITSFYPFRMPLGERAVLEKVRAIPLCMLRNEKGEPDTYVFYTRNGVDPDFLCERRCFSYYDTHTF